MTPREHLASEKALVRERMAELDAARERERVAGEKALADGISAEKREALRNLQLSARAEVKLREKALAHRLPSYRLAHLRVAHEIVNSR